MNQAAAVKNAAEQQQNCAIRFTGTDLRFRYAESVMHSQFQQQEFDQSVVIQKEQLIYSRNDCISQIKEENQQYEKQTVRNNTNLAQSKLKIDGKWQNENEDSYCVQLKVISPTNKDHHAMNQLQLQDMLFSDMKAEQKEEINYQSLVPQHYTVSRLQRVNQNQYESTKSDNFPIKQIYYRPVEIQLPPKTQSYNDSVEQHHFVILQCTFQTHNQKQKELNPQTITPTIITEQKINMIANVEQENSKKQNDTQIKTQTKQNGAGKQQKEKEQKDQGITDVLLQKIGELQSKVKQLEQQRKRAEQLMRDSDTKSLYNSIPNSLPAFGSIRKNDLNKQFNTINETRETNAINHQFRVRSVVNKSLSGSQSRINSNIYNMTLVETGYDKNIKDQIKVLKQKLQALENTHIFNDPAIKNTIKENNLKILQNEFNDRVNSPSRKQLGGKIVKLHGTKLSQSPDNTMRSNILQSAQTDREKGFIRSGPADRMGETSNHACQTSNLSQINQTQYQQTRKKADSSAIFRKNLGPAIAQKQRYIIESQILNGINTLQFNPEGQKIFFTESKDIESMMFRKNESMSPILPTKITDIYIPELVPYPTPQSSSEQLVQIGKITFRKLGCEVTENTILNVKKYKNCVHFSIGFEQHILWHYQGKFYYGGWQTHANGQGEKLGHGVQYAPSKYRYKGNFKDGKRSGFGTMIHENGTSYVGQWLEGLKHGKGRLLELEGIQYEGQWKMGKKNGFGKILNEGVLQFEGNFIDGLKNGNGKQNFENGDFYQGNYKDNKFEGKGTYFWKTGAVYTGEFKNGKRHGHGVWRSGQNNYDIYEGEYAQDNKNGHGIYKWANGTIYKGSFKDDLKHGQGCITYENGKVSYMVWNKGNVDKSMSNSQRFESEHKKNISSSAHFKSRKGMMTRSTANLHSAKSSSNLQRQRSMPRGLNLRRENQSEAKGVQYRSKVKNKDFIKIKIGSQSINNRYNNNKQAEAPKDPPYKTLQTTSNINRNL